VKIEAATAVVGQDIPELGDAPSLFCAVGDAVVGVAAGAEVFIAAGAGNAARAHKRS
jgi:hypothetical protein